MSEKELEDGVERFEGKEVSSYTGRFSGSFDVDFSQGVTMGGDDLVAFFVTARVGDAKFSTSKSSGLLSRQNTFTVEDVTAMDLAKAKWLYDQLGKVVVGVTEMIEVSQAPAPKQEEQLFPLPPATLPVAPNTTNGVKPLFLDVKLAGNEVAS